MAPPVAADIIPAKLAQTLSGLLIERVRRSPDATAYVQYDPASAGWAPQSWREAADAVGRWQRALRREGLDPGERVAVQMANRREWIYFDVAAVGLGLVTVPLYTNDRPENVRYILEETDARLLLVDTAERLRALSPIAETLRGLARILVLEPGGGNERGGAKTTSVADWLQGTPAEPVDEARGSDSLATIVYTSGTTGSPKGVMLTHRNLLWNAEAVMRVIPGLPSDRFLSFLPLSHALERTGGCYLPMMAGATVHFARSIPQLGEDMSIVRPTILIAVPRIFERVHARIMQKLAEGPAPSRVLFRKALDLGYRGYEHAQGRAPWRPGLLLAPLLDRLVGAKVRARMGGALRVAVSGGAPISADIARFFLGLGVPLIQGYGLTEAGPVVTLNPMEDNRPDSIGKPLPDLEARIGPDDELWVRSPGVMQGYWRQPEASAAVLDPDGWLRTGDQVRMDAEGHVFITGRLKEIIVLANGEKVPPADMELAIAGDELISQVLVVGEGRPYLTALVVLDPDAYARFARSAGLDPDPLREDSSPRLEEMLRERISTRLAGFPGYARIHRVGVVARPWSIDDNTMTPTMKLKRSRILARLVVEVQRLYENRRGGGGT
jgi:long-chain acyl-CoA synthetase